MKRARDVMTRWIVTVPPDAPLRDVITKLDRHGVNAVPVVDADGRLLGMISRADVVRDLHGTNGSGT